jgi:hypothetical protein
MLNHLDIDFLLVCLRRELNKVDRAIVSLEQIARTNRAEAGVPRRPMAGDSTAHGGTGKGRSHHRLRAS